MQRRTTQEQQRHHHDQRGDLGHDGARQGLVDGLVQRHSWHKATIGLETLADAVEHDDGVVDGVTHHGQQRGHHRQIERGLRQRKPADDQDGVMHQRQDGTGRKPPGVEAQCDVDEHQQQGDGERRDGAVAQLIAHLRADDFQRLDRHAGVDAAQRSFDARANLIHGDASHPAPAVRRCRARCRRPARWAP